MAAPSKIRTAAELQNPDLNYFIAFKINVDETDVTKIEDAIKKKRNTFAREQSVINSRLVELKEDIDQIMLNDAVYTTDPNTGMSSYAPNKGGRKQEAQRAKSIYLSVAVAAAESICGRGYIWDYELSQIAEKNAVDEKELHSKISHLFKQGVSYKQSASTKREVPFNNLSKIEVQLRTINKKDLYDFLDLTPAASLDEIKNKQDALYSAAQKQGKNAQATAIINLCGLVKVVFKTAQGKKEYDIYCQCREQIWEKLQMFKNSGIKNINDKLLTEFMDIMKQSTKLSVDEAEKELDAYLQFFGIVRETSGGAMKFAVCPYDECGMSYIVKPGVKTCPNCGRSLEIRCWNCGEISLFTSKHQACSKCSVTKNHQTDFNNAEKDFNARLHAPEFSEIDLVAALNKLENVFPGYEKLPQAFVSKRIAEAKKAIDKKKKEKAESDAIYDKYVKEINVLFAKKQFCKAEDLVKKLKNEAPTYDTKTFDDKINAAIKSAQQFVNMANNAMKTNNESGAIEFCGKALEVCSDYAAAVQVLKNYPPKAPRIITTRIVRNTVKIDWQTEGDQSAVTYTILRKIGSAPANDEDGEVLEDGLTINFFEDSGVVSATAYFYGVFAERGGVRSKLVITPNPVVMFLDVTNLHQEKTDDSIKATWSVPDNVKSVEVYRKPGVIPPSSINDGTRVPTEGLNSFVDRDLKEDKNSYLVVCKYNYLGKEHYSAGIKASYKRFSIPKMITNPKLTSAGAHTDFNFECDMPVNGAVKLYIAQRRYEYAFGIAEDKATFQKKYKDLSELDATVVSDTKFYFSAPDKKILWLYPVVANEQLAVICPPLPVNTIKGIDGINVVNKGGNILIEGAIAPNVRNVIAIINSEKFVDSEKAEGERRVCTYDTFVGDKGFYMNLKPGIYYVTLFAEFSEAGKITYSRPTPLPDVIDNREKEIVKYQMDYELSVRAPYKVRLTFMADRMMELPDIDIVGGYPKPLNKNGGVTVGTMKGGEMKKKLFKQGYFYTATVTVDAAGSMKDKLSLFFSSPSVGHLMLKPVMKL